MSELLFEIYSEEVPSAMQEFGSQNLYNKISEDLKDIMNPNSQGECFFTPRRMGFYIKNIKPYIEEKVECIRGPKTTAPEQAINGFLKKYDLDNTNQLIKKEEYFYYEKKHCQKEAKTFIQEVIESVLASFDWPKSMLWGTHKIKWVRPIKSILCVFNKDIIPIHFGHITAQNFTYKNWLITNEKFKITSFDEYHSLLKEAAISIFQNERISLIKKEINNICKNLKCEFIEDQYLLKEVANLVEYPYLAVGKIDKQFMSLPKEVLITTLKFHQKYLMLKDSNNDVAPYFIIVSNVMTDDNLKTVIDGNEKVLRARLADAQFFYEQDTKSKLSEKCENLKKLTFHRDIGDYYQKIISIKEVAFDIANQMNYPQQNIISIIPLLKTDLVTDMVSELPELQGVMGYYYALNDGEKNEIALAIKEHYKPQGPSDNVPHSDLSIIMALSDKIVTLNEMFKIGIKPTGSKDPFALRRAAIGIIRIVCQNKLNIDLTKIIKNNVSAFISERIKILEKEEKNLYNIDFKYIHNSLVD
ncbi:MAG: glycyl-tRNA synthetase beta chain [Candidatus Midichloriaceae bacterium]|jgi:glycyl-tRNA synthetase beta chain